MAMGAPAYRQAGWGFGALARWVTGEGDWYYCFQLAYFGHSGI